MVFNRTFERAARLAAELGAQAVSSPQPAELLVNCTSVGLHGLPDSGERQSPIGKGSHERITDSATEAKALNELSLSADQVGRYTHVTDLVYSDSDTPLLAAARRHGCRTVDGVEMLVAQGALSFELWTGRPAPRDVMRAAAAPSGGRTSEP